VGDGGTRQRGAEADLQALVVRGASRLASAPVAPLASLQRDERKPYGSSRSLGLKRGTVVKHTKYGLCTVGGFDRKRQSISLHAYRTNKRLTQGASVKQCHVLTWVAFRSWLLRGEPLSKSGKGGVKAPPMSQLDFGEVAIATVALWRWGSYFAVLANHDLRHFRKRIRAAVQLLPFPSVQLDGSTYYNRFRALGAFNWASEDSIS
jgi:hypothetical protein